MNYELNKTHSTLSEQTVLFKSYYKHLNIAIVDFFLFRKNTEIKKQSRNNIGILFQNKRYFVHPFNDILKCQACKYNVYISKNKISFKMP